MSVMKPGDGIITILLFAMLFYAFMSLYVIGMVLRPLLTTALNGLIDFAR